MSKSGKLSQLVYRIIILAAVTLFLIPSTSRASVTQQVLQTKPDATSQASQPAQGEIRKLELGKPIERELKGGESHTYEINLEANQYLNAVIEQKGIDVAVQVIAPDGKPILEINDIKSRQGIEKVVLIVEISATYRFNIISSEKGTESGLYRIQVNELHTASQYERDLSESTKSIKEFERLFQAGKYDDALQIGERVLATRERILGAEHPDVAEALNNLGVVYRMKGDYAKAETAYIRALTVTEKALGQEDSTLLDILNNLANLYRIKGDYVKAEPLFMRALPIGEKAFGNGSLAIVDALSNLATVYQIKGDYAKAEPLFIRALEIREKNLKQGHPSIGVSLNNLGLLYSERGFYDKSETFYIRALEIWEKSLGTKHPFFSVALNGLANVYKDRGEFDKAERLFLRALAIREEVFGKESRDYATALYSLAALYRAKGDYVKAEPLYLRSLTIFEKVVGAEHPDTAISLNGLAMLYGSKGDYAKAVEFQSRCNDVSDREIVRNLASGSERQKLAYLSQTAGYTSITISLHTQSVPNDRKAKRAALKVLLQRKGRAFDAMTDAIAVLRRRASPEDQELFAQFQELRSQISVLTLKGAGREGLEKHKANLKVLEEQEEKLQNDISQRSAEFRAQSQTQSKPVTIEIIQKVIPEGATLIEFAQYRPVNTKEADKKKRFGKPRYVAYILNHTGEPTFVELGDAKIIDDKIAAFRKALRNKHSRNVTQLARSLDAAVMQPVRKLLGQTRRVFLSPDGKLNLVPFAAFVDERKQYLVKRYSFTYLTSGRDLLRLQTKIEGKTSRMVIADPDFGDKKATATNALNTANSSTTSNPSGASNVASDNNGGVLDDLYFAPLKATAAEARDLQRLFPDAVVITKAQATEAALKAADRPAILHIATHGFFLSDEQQLDSQAEGEKTRLVVRRKQQSESEREDDSAQLVNPLLRSGLGLAGANERSGNDGNDGILTALEAAGLDLWGTKLVVLSACDTGVGEVKTGDGVYGLRRALVLAGSESQMMSLWPVSDTGTRELMTNYYRRLKLGEGRSEALRRVQLRMLASKNRNHPFFWASFIQSGEWANLDGRRVD